MSATYLDPSSFDASVLRSKRVAVLGYGNQGAAHSANLRDAGVQVVVGARPESPTFALAEKAGFTVMPTAEAASWGNCILMALPDVKMGTIFREQIEPGLVPGDSVLFIHGYALRFELVPLVSEIDFLLVSHKGAGYAVREAFLHGPKLACLIGIEQDATGRARDLAIGYALTVGAAPDCLIQTTAREECESDLFGEQVILCGGISQLIQRSFQVLMNRGYSPEIAYFECVQELKILADLVASRGLAGMRSAISDTAEWGDYVVGPSVVGESSRRAMEKALDDIQSGSFAAEWQLENETGLARMTAFRAEGTDTLLERTGRELRRRLHLPMK